MQLLLKWQGPPPPPPPPITDPTRHLFACVYQLENLKCKVAMFSLLNISPETCLPPSEHTFPFVTSTLVLVRVTYILSMSEQNPGCNTRKTEKRGFKR